MERLRNDRRRVLFTASAVVFFLMVFVLLVNMDMLKEVSHDENIFIAGGALASHSLIPYRDFGYNHMPYLAFIYGALFRFTDYLLLTGRGVSAVCELAVLGLVFAVAWNLYRERRNVPRFLIAAGAVLLLGMNPLFIYTSGYAWNHALPVLAALLAFMVQHHGVRQEGGAKWVLLSGLLLGLAVGIRLVFALAIPPMAAVILLAPGVTPRARVRLFLWFAAGLAVAMLPALVMFMLAPDRFMFNVVTYHPFGAPLTTERGVFRALTPFTKLTWFVTEILRDPGNLLLACLAVACALSLRVRGPRPRMSGTFEAGTAMAVALFLLVGAFSSTPPWPQYFYAPVPFLVLGIVYALGSMEARGARRTWVLPLFVLAILASSVSGIRDYAHVKYLLSSRSLSAWVPIATHRLGTEIRRRVGEGGVLTLAPIYPLEGGARIYCAFSEGPFFWRVGHLLSVDQRSKLGIVSPAELDALLRAHAPDAVLVGFEAAYKEGDLEIPLLDYAKAHRFGVVRLRNNSDLWLSPAIHATDVGNATPGGDRAARLHPCI